MDKLKQVTHIDNVRLGEDERSVVILDQTQLPNRTEYKTLRTPEEMFEAILTHDRQRCEAAIDRHYDIIERRIQEG